MKDCSGNNVKVGDRVMVVRKENRGKVLTVRWIGLTEWSKGKPLAKCDDSPDGHLTARNFTLAAYLQSDEIALIPSSTSPTPPPAPTAGSDTATQSTGPTTDRRA